MELFYYIHFQYFSGDFWGQEYIIWNFQVSAMDTSACLMCSKFKHHYFIFQSSFFFVIFLMIIKKIISLVWSPV